MDRYIIVAALAAIAQARFGRENVPIAAIGAVQGGAAGAAATIAGGAISDLLAGANACDKLTTADQIVSELGGGADAIAAAIGMVAAEKNTNPFNVDIPSICSDPTLPVTPELRGITPLIDPATNNAAVANDLSAQTVQTPLDATGKSVADLLTEAGFTDFTPQAAGAAAGGAAGAGNAAAGAGNAAAGAGNAAATGAAQNAAATGVAQNAAAACPPVAAAADQKAGNGADAGKKANAAGGAAAGAANANKKGNAAAGANANNNAAANDNAAGNDNANANNGNANANVGNANANAGNANANNGNANANAGNANANNGNANAENGNANNNNNNAAGAAAGGAGGADDFGTCDPTMSFEGGRAGRAADEFTFQSNDAVIAANQQEALNPNIITNRICDELTNICGANAAAIATCDAAQAQILALNTRDQTTADAWNALVGGGAAKRSMRRGMRQ